MSLNALKLLNTLKSQRKMEKAEDPVAPPTRVTQEELLTHLLGLVQKLQQMLMFKELFAELDQMKGLIGNPDEIIFGKKGAEPAPQKGEGHLVTHSELARTGDRAGTLDALEKVTTVRRDSNGNTREFLLHRPTVDFEYEKSAIDDKRGMTETRNEADTELRPLTYKTDRDTEWGVDVVGAIDRQKSANPVVSCWVPEKDIKGVPNPHENVGTWGELGANPFTSRYRVVVGAGSYEIYQEVKV